MAKWQSEKEKQINIRLGQQLQHYRELAGISRQDLGKQLGVSYQQIQKYEHASNAISTARLHSICEALGIDISTFLNLQTSGKKG